MLLWYKLPLYQMRGFTGVCIEGVPMGFSFDSEDNGSADYSCGKLDKYYPEVACA